MAVTVWFQLDVVERVVVGEKITTWGARGKWFVGARGKGLVVGQVHVDAVGRDVVVRCLHRGRRSDLRG